jgi:hypothetical protein
MITVYHCPRCGAELQSSGVLAVDAVEMPVFQCDTCTVKRELFGAGSGEIELAFTFAVNAAGQPVSPGDESLL